MSNLCICSVPVIVLGCELRPFEMSTGLTSVSFPLSETAGLLMVNTKETDMAMTCNVSAKQRRLAGYRPGSAALVIIAQLLAMVALSGCATFGAAGPSSSAVRKAGTQSYASKDIAILDVNDAVMARINARDRSQTLIETMGESPPASIILGAGDSIDISLLEAAPAILFGNGILNLPGGMSPPGSQRELAQQQVVDVSGAITVPFVGKVQASGRSPAEIEREIVRRLSGKANNPQAVVRLIQNEARTVTVLGEVNASRRVPLGPRGERLLDVLASAGGPRQPVGKTTVRVSRGNASATMALDRVIRDPAQNIRLRPEDVVTVSFQPFSFVALGAVSQNAEVPFEGGGISLAQALGRIGGLRDDRANIKGVFVFRMEDVDALDPSIAASAQRTSEGKTPVIFRLNLAEGSSFFAAQEFMIRDKDVIYVSTAPGSDVQRFVSTLSGFAFSAIALGNAVSNRN
jgi:polysaccharide biosynthesis/export protein